jgi:hypothetical protein
MVAKVSAFCAAVQVCPKSPFAENHEQEVCHLELFAYNA